MVVAALALELRNGTDEQRRIANILWRMLPGKRKGDIDGTEPARAYAEILGDTWVQALPA